jgi:hypothetical protein
MAPEFRTLRVAYSALLAALCVLVLGTHVHCGFDRHRFRLVTTPVGADGSSLSVALPDLRVLAGAPAAVILRVSSGSSPLRLTLALDDQPFAGALVEPASERRIDVVKEFPPGTGHRFVIAADRDGWRLDYLEIANVHGFSRGLVEFVIVPRERRVERPVPVWLLVPIFIGLVAARPGRFEARGLRRVHLVLSIVVLALFAGLLLAPILSPYRVLLAAGSALLCLALLYAEPIARGARHLWIASRPWLVPAAQQAWDSRASRAARPFLPHLVASAVFLGSVAQFYEPDVGFTSLVKFGATFEHRALPALKATPHAVEPTPGYDGQFYAQVALDPLLRSREIRRALDSPVYRARRILMPWAAWVMGGGQPWWILQAYALLNVLCWLALGWILFHWLPPGSLRPTLAWLGCMFSHGLLTSVRESVPDGPSVLLIALAIRAVDIGRPTVSAWTLGLAALCRETNVLGSVILLPRHLRPRRSYVSAGLRMLIVLAPLALWLSYLWSIDLPMRHAGARNLAAPFTGYGEKWVATFAGLQAEGWGSFARLSLLSMTALTTQAAFLLLSRQWNVAWWRTGVVYLALMAVLGRAVWEGHPGAVTRVVLPMTFAFNVLVLKSRWFWPLWVLGNLSVLGGLETIHAPVFGPGKSLWRPFG